MAEQPKKEEEIFLASLEKTSLQERNVFVDAACVGDSNLLQRVKELLNSHDESIGPLDSPPSGVASPTIHHPVTEKPGTVIGPYKLLQQIGEGGMGVVYMAEQREPVSRRVALKIIKPGMDTRQVIARFEAERQALAMMDHPNVSKVLDAGTTDTGRPYFVMELVKGLPITKYCDQHKLNVRERLELFVPVCQAIQHAHQKGIIHRDIKPSNVMIARYDDQPVPKIIDFGVAKAVEHRLTEKTVFTQFGQIVGTFEYMSPEQAQFNQLDIDTRSDVYSLGVLLYELLTGETPFDGERLRSAAFDELLRIIREEDPLRPSARLSTSDTAPENAANRQVAPKRLSALVQGELDWIVMKALEKDRTRRYDTATAFGADVEHYLNDEPVEACPPSSIYMIGKFTRRNKGWLSTAAAVLLTVFVGLTVSTILIAKERDAAEESAERETIAAEIGDQQRRRAEENLRQAREAVDRVFTKVAYDLKGTPHMELIRRELLEDALEFYQGFLKQKGDDPEIRQNAGLAHFRVSDIHEELGDRKSCIEHAHHSVSIFERLCRDFPDNVDYRYNLANSYHKLGIGLQKKSDRNSGTGHRAEIVDYMTKSLDIYEELARRFPNEPKYRGNAAIKHVSLADALDHILGKSAEAERHLRESIALWEKFRQDFPNLLEQGKFEESHSHSCLAGYLWSNGRHQEAEDHIRRAIELRTKLVDRSPQDRDVQEGLGHAKIFLGTMLLRSRKLAEAEENIRSAVDLYQPLVNDFPDINDNRERLQWAYESLSKLLLSQRHFANVEELYLRLLEISRPLLKNDPDAARNIAWQHYNLGLLYYHQGKIVRAAESFREAFTGFERVMSESDPNLTTDRQAEDALRWTLATCPLPQFRDAQRSIAYSNEFLQQEPESAYLWNSLGIGHYRADNFGDAIEALNKSADLRDRPAVSDCYFLAMAHWRSGEQGKAHEWYQQGVRKEKDAGRGFDLDLENFRRETKKVLGITDDEKENAAPSEVEAETEDTKPAEVRPDAADEPSPQSNN